jgi:hypothetical protein
LKKSIIADDNDLSQIVMRRIFKNNFEMDFCESIEIYYKK